MRKKGGKKEKDTTERWLLSYADFMTLLLAFFIIMYASSKMDESKYKAISESFKAALGGGQTIIGSSSAVDVKKTPQVIQNKKTVDQSKKNENRANTNSVGDSTQAEQNKLKELQQQINNYINTNNMANSVSTQIDDRGLVIRIQDALFFDSGKADIKTEWVNHLMDIGNMLKTIDNYIRIEGHTDNVPISTPEYQDNLALSCARAANVYRLFVSQAKLNPGRMSAEGYADSRPVADNNSEAGKARNRRVDIVVIDSKYNGAEVTK